MENVCCVCSSWASAAVNNLKRFHEKKKRGLKPHSLYLDHIIRKSVSSHNRRESHSRAHRDIYVIKVNMNMLFQNLFFIYPTLDLPHSFIFV